LGILSGILGLIGSGLVSAAPPVGFAFLFVASCVGLSGIVTYYIPSIYKRFGRAPNLESVVCVESGVQEVRDDAEVNEQATLSEAE
jgi:hypothetical protein